MKFATRFPKVKNTQGEREGKMFIETETERAWWSWNPACSLRNIGKDDILRRWP